jgi:site-specific DNA-methyltransferase (adenine-specific)
MSDLDHLAISRILGSTVHAYSHTDFGGFSAVKAVGEMLATRPKPSARLGPDTSRDAKIIDAFKKTHKGYSVDRVLADPDLVHQFIELAQRLGVDASPALINRRLLRIRKAGDLKVETTVEEKRDLRPFLIPAELAFAHLTYHHDASYDDLLADPEIGAAFDALALKVGRGGNAVDYRLAALHLRKNIRSRRGSEGKKLANFGIADLTQRWRLVGPFAKIAIDDLPTAKGIFALSEPNRFLYLTRYPNIREGVDLFRDPAVLAAMGNRFWTPSLESISLQLIRQEDISGTTLRLLELKALEVYRPIFNLLPTAA